jgi:hypothetical protein
MHSPPSTYLPAQAPCGPEVHPLGLNSIIGAMSQQPCAYEGETRHQRAAIITASERGAAQMVTRSAPQIRAVSPKVGPSKDEFVLPA